MLCVGHPTIDPTRVVFYTGAIVAVCAMGITYFTLCLACTDCGRYSYITAKGTCALSQEQTRMVSFLHTRCFFAIVFCIIEVIIFPRKETTNIFVMMLYIS